MLFHNTETTERCVHANGSQQPLTWWLKGENGFLSIESNVFVRWISSADSDVHKSPPLMAQLLKNVH